MPFRPASRLISLFTAGVMFFGGEVFLEGSEERDLVLLERIAAQHPELTDSAGADLSDGKSGPFVTITETPEPRKSDGIFEGFSGQAVLVITLWLLPFALRKGFRRLPYRDL